MAMRVSKYLVFSKGCQNRASELTADEAKLSKGHIRIKQKRLIACDIRQPSAEVINCNHRKIPKPK